MLAILATYWKPLAIAAAIVALFGLWQLDRHSQFEAGRSAERQAAVERANTLIEKMEKDNAQISDMDRRAKCAEFGYRWVRDQGCVD